MTIQLSEEHLLPFLLDDHKTVITTVTNYGYLFYTLNMLKSLKQYGLDKKIFIVSIDRKGKETLEKFGYEAYCIDDQTLGKFCPWNSKGYDKICYLKLELIYRILSLNKNLLLVDGDIVFLKDPLEDINKWLEDKIYDIWIQNDSQENKNTTNMCTGYLFIKSSDRLIELYDCVSEKGKKKYEVCAFDNNDQTYFNKFIKSGCMMCPLLLENYPNGKMFYTYCDSYERIMSTIVLVHFNWVQGHLKMAKMKEYKLWFLTPEEEEMI
jgi:Nucleotide-diphospho-sugar transferase